jgi:hypothetical protein
LAALNLTEEAPPEQAKRAD